MVGMSGKASEPRSGATGTSKKQQPVPGSHNRAVPPQEALQMARILNDSTRQVSVSELDRLITEVLHVASGRSSEEASIALHDNNFDVEKAITVLVDTENGGSTGEWTTTGRHRKKRGAADSEQIVAPGDAKTKSRGQGSKGSTSKAAAASTRESYGGGVTVTEGGSRPPPKSGRAPGGQSGRGQDNRGRSQSGRRPMDKPKGADRDRRKEKGTFTGSDRGDRQDRDHGDKSDRDRRGDRGDRSDHTDKWERNNPADRGDFSDRWDRGDRGDRGNRGGRGNRDDRGDRNDRGNRGDRGDRQEGRRERRDRDRGDDRRNNEDRRGLDERKGDRGGSGFNGKKGQRRQRDRTEKFQWENNTSSQLVSVAEPPSETENKQHKSSAFHESWNTESWDTQVTATPTMQDKDKEEVPSHTYEEPRQEDGHAGTLFPDALPTPATTATSYQSHSQLPALSTPAETTPNLMSIGEGSERALQRAEASEQRTEQTAIKVSAPVSSSPGVSASVQAASQKRSKRLARSRIPTKPVEMPGGVDTLDLEFGQFGIDFIGLDPQKEPETTPTTTPPISTEFAQTAERPIMYTEVQRLADDPSILGVVPQSSPPSQPLPMDLPSPVGVAQSYPAHSTTEQRPLVGATHRSEPGSAAMVSRVESVEASETLLDAPPGLPRPATVPGMESAKSSQSLPSPSQQQQQQHQHLALSINTSVSPSSSSTAANSAISSGGGLADAARNSAGSVSIQMQTPEPLEMPHQQSSMPSSHPSHSHYPVTSSTSDLLISSVTSAATSASMPTSVGMTSGSTSTSSSHLRGSGSSQHMGATHSAISQHSSLHQQQQAASKQLPTAAAAAAANMVYHPTPPMMQYPLVMPMYPHNYPDPSEIGRQFPVSLPYYNTSSDHSLAPSSTYGSGGGGAMSDHSKYSRGTGTSDGSTPVTSQQQQQQQQHQQQQPQGGQQGSGSGLQQGQHMQAHFMNYPYPPFYSHMYHMPHGGFSAPHNMAPKPSGTGSNLSTYQHQHHAAGSSAFGGAAGTGGSSATYEDMISGGGSSGSTSHHDQFGSKIYGSSLSKSAVLPTSGGDVGSGLGGGATSAFTKHYEGSKSMGGSAANSYNYGLGNQYLGYMSGMGMPGMPLPHHIPAATQVMQGSSAHDNTGGGVVTRSGLQSHGSIQKHGGKSMNAYQSSALWSQSAHS